MEMELIQPLYLKFNSQAAHSKAKDHLQTEIGIFQLRIGTQGDF